MYCAYSSSLAVKIGQRTVDHVRSHIEVFGEAVAATAPSCFDVDDCCSQKTNTSNIIAMLGRLLLQSRLGPRRARRESLGSPAVCLSRTWPPRGPSRSDSYPKRRAAAPRSRSGPSREITEFSYRIAHLPYVVSLQSAREKKDLHATPVSLV